MTITLELEVPDSGKLAEILAPMSPQERNHYAVAKLTRAAEEEGEESDDLPEAIRADHYKLIAASIEAHKAGRYQDGREAMTELRAKYLPNTTSGNQ